MPDTPAIQALLAELQKEQALQGQILQQISENISRNMQTINAQGSQINGLAMDISLIKNDIAAYRNDIVSLNAWRNESHTLFVPRKEHEAARHEERIKSLEAAQVSDVRQDAQEKHGFMQWLISNALTVFLTLMVTIINIILAFKH